SIISVVSLIFNTKKPLNTKSSEVMVHKLNMHDIYRIKQSIIQLKKHKKYIYLSCYCTFNYSSPIQTLTVGSGVTPDQPCYIMITQVTGLRINCYPFYRRLGISPDPRRIMNNMLLYIYFNAYIFIWQVL